MRPRTAVALLLAITLAACVDTGTRTAHEKRFSPPDLIAKGEALTVVGLTRSEDIVRCVDQALRAERPDLKVIPPKEFRDAMFPWFEPHTAPTDSSGLAHLMGRKVVKRRIEEFGVRYVIALGGESTETGGKWGGVVGPGPGPGAGFMLGGSSVDRRTILNATLLDLKKARPVAAVDTSAAGGGGAGVIILIPYAVIPPATEAITCGEVAKRIVAYLTGKPAPPNVDDTTRN